MSLGRRRKAAGQVSHRPLERPHRVRVERLHAQAVGTFVRRLSPDAARACALGVAPACSKTARRYFVDAARRRYYASTSSRTAASCPDRSTARLRSGTCRSTGPAGASRRWPTRTGRGAGVQQNRASICADAARAQVGCVVALPNGDVVSGSTDHKVKVFADVRPILRMVNRVAWRRAQWNGAGRAIAEFI